MTDEQYHEDTADIYSMFDAIIIGLASLSGAAFVAVALWLAIS